MTRSPSLPEQFGRYRILHRLGGGGMGTVYLAHDQPLDRKVALKVMNLDPEGDGTAVERFFREARAAAALEHPNICPVYDLGQIDGIHFITMKLIEGQPLTASFTRDAPTAPAKAVELVRTLALALEAMHQKGIIHRDVKPANVMLTPSGQPVLVDFGLARWVVGSHRVLSQSGDIIGTPSYMAPEQVRGKKDELGPGCDVYSLGVLLYEILTGVRPFDAPDFESLLYQIVHSTPEPPRKLRPEIGPALDAACMKALAKRPADRFASMADFAAELGRCLQPARAATADDGWATSGDLGIRLRATFDRDGYPGGEDPTARFLLELEVRPTETATLSQVKGVSADLLLVLDVSGSMNAPDRYPLLRSAVLELLRRLSPDDRVGIAVFSAGADLIAPPIPAAEAARSAQAIVERMDHSPLTFGGGTQLEPGLRRALAALEALPPRDSVRRVYVLTDGELHDTEACKHTLVGFRPKRTEVHVYGFGTAFVAGDLKRLVSDQIGGSVKPICDQQEVISTFAHIAEVNRRLTAGDGVLTIDFDPAIACGDAWTFRPQERHLGRIQHRRVIRELGGLEEGRTYSLLVEIGLPPDVRTLTRVATAKLNWRSGDRRSEYGVEVEAARLPGAAAGKPVVRIGQAFAVLDALRKPDDHERQVVAVRARLELARQEGRDPDLISALEKQLGILEGRLSESEIDHECQLHLKADQATKRKA